jgi:hypothetical protein
MTRSSRFAPFARARKTISKKMKNVPDVARKRRTRLVFMDYLLKYQTVICSIESIWSKIPT